MATAGAADSFDGVIQLPVDVALGTVGLDDANRSIAAKAAEPTKTSPRRPAKIDARNLRWRQNRLVLDAKNVTCDLNCTKPPD
jgi:hypothetical protein